VKQGVLNAPYRAWKRDAHLREFFQSYVTWMSSTTQGESFHEDGVLCAPGIYDIIIGNEENH